MAKKTNTKFHSVTAPGVTSKGSTQKVMFILTIAILAIVGMSLYYQFAKVSTDAGLAALSIYGVALLTAFVCELI